MNTFFKSAAVAVIMVASFNSAPASAQVLGGLLGGGDSSGGGLIGGVVDTVNGVVGGVTGGDSSGGGLLGGNGTGLGPALGDVVTNLTGTDSLGVNIPGVASVTIDGTNGVAVGGDLLGGGGGNLNVPLGGLLGGNTGINLGLPGLNNILPQDGKDGAPGAPGRPGVNGGNGFNGFNGVAGLSGSRGSNGSNGINGLNGSSKLKMLARILENRAWLRFAKGQRVCLPTYGVASVSTWLPQREHNQLRNLLGNYRSDIATLQNGMARCKGRQAVNLDSVIGVDLRNDGTVVVFTL